MNRAVREDTLLFPVGEQTLDCAVGETNLLGPVGEVLLNLVVLKLEHLKAIGERCLRSFRLGEEVNDLAGRERLLDVLVLEEDHLVAIGPYFSLDSVRKHDFFLATLVELLALAFLAQDFVDKQQILVRFIRVVLFRENQVEVFLIFFLDFLALKGGVLFNVHFLHALLTVIIFVMGCHRLVLLFVVLEVESHYLGRPLSRWRLVLAVWNADLIAIGVLDLVGCRPHTGVHDLARLLRIGILLLATCAGTRLVEAAHTYLGRTIDIDRHAACLFELQVTLVVLLRSLLLNYGPRLITLATSRVNLDLLGHHGHRSGSSHYVSRARLLSLGLLRRIAPPHHQLA